eukprot:COSAG02_NODE_1095_length_14602_cov_33.808867_10_plen_633_part_00
MIAAVFLRPFVRRAWQQRSTQQTPPADAQGLATNEFTNADNPRSRSNAEADAAAAQAPAGVAAAVEQEESSATSVAAGAAIQLAAPEARAPARWGPDRNDWWEGGLGLAPRRTTAGRAASLRDYIDILVVVLSGRSAKYATRRETIRSTWSGDIAAHAAKQKINLKVIFAISDNFCGYDPGKLSASVTSFPATHCKQAHEHNAGGQVSDEHTALLAEYRRNKDIVFVPQTIDAYYTSATKMRTFYKCLIEAKVSFGILIKVDDDGVILRKRFFEHYNDLREIMDPARRSIPTGKADLGPPVGPRWWGHFNEWWAPVRAEDEAAEVAARLTRSEHNWFVTEDEWPYHWFPTFAIGTGHALNYAAVECFARLTSHRSTARPQEGGSDSGGNPIDAGTAVWMEDVAHGVWFDVCAAEYEKKKGHVAGGNNVSSRVGTNVVTQQDQTGRACRVFDWRWVKGPGADACRPDAHAIGSIGSRSAQQHTAKLGRAAKCPCTSEGGSACSESGADVSKFHSQLLSAEAKRGQHDIASGAIGGRSGKKDAWLWPFVRCGTSAQIMMDAELMVLNSSTLANDNSRWPKLAPPAADIVAEVEAVSVGGHPDSLIRSTLKEPRLCTIERECVPVPAVFNPVRPT